MGRRVVRAPPYKDFLQAALQKRFISTAGILTFTVYIESVLLAPWSSYLWTWFPFGPTGVRAFFLFLSGIWILFLRIGQYHVGTRTAPSSFRCLLQHALKLHTAEVFFAYLVSTAFFWPVFMATRSHSSQMTLIHHIGNDRHRLNEKPLFLGSYLFLVAIAQSLYHLWRDHDALYIGIVRRGLETRHSDAVLLQQMVRSLPNILIRSSIASTFMIMVNTVVYHTFFRKWIWSWTLSFTRPFYNLPRTNILPAAWPLTLTTIIQCTMSGFLLLFMWQVCNVAFSKMIVREPLKNGKPLTSESKDPNGSLINGLKSKKLSVRSFALWELAHIAESFPDRRKAIFDDIDRPEGPMWSQVCQSCLHTFNSISKRISNYNAPAPIITSSPIITVKDRTVTPVREGDIFQSHDKPVTIKGELEKAIVHAIASGSQTSTGISPMARRAVEATRDRLISREQQEALSSENVEGWFKQLGMRVVENENVGPFFREEFGKRVASVVMGSPYGEKSVYINAATALSGLAVASLTEDKLGKVYLDVGEVIRVFTRVIGEIEDFMEGFPRHWTDVVGSREAYDVQDIVKELRKGLSELLDGFESYAGNLRLTTGDLRAAKETAARRKMREV